MLNINWNYTPSWCFDLNCYDWHVHSSSISWLTFAFVSIFTDTQDENDGDSENIGNISVDEENLTPLGQIQKCAHSDSLWTR